VWEQAEIESTSIIKRSRIVRKQLFALAGLTALFFNISDLVIAGEVIPGQFLGEWGNKNCRQAGDVQADESGAPIIQIDRTSVRVMDMNCELKIKTKSDSTVFVGKFLCESEGESSDSLITLNLNKGSLVYGISEAPDGFGSGSGDLLQRCK
jgi:hypothetical protein